MHDRSFRILSKQLQLLNRHLAKSRRELNSLLKEDRPEVILRDGSRHIFKKGELTKIANILPYNMHNIKLPLYIELSPEKFGRGTARILGKAECRLVSNILGIKESKEELFLYRHDILKLRKELPTTTQYMFTA
ncbi:MAG: DUF61 family protein [Thermodesulfobacteriota bacterium]